MHALNRVQSTSVENWQFPLNYGKLHSANVFSSKFSAILTANDGQLMTACSRLVVTTMSLSLVSLVSRTAFTDYCLDRFFLSYSGFLFLVFFFLFYFRLCAVR